MPAIFILSNNLLCWKILPNYIYLKARREGYYIIVLSNKSSSHRFAIFLRISLNFGARAWGLEQPMKSLKCSKKFVKNARKSNHFFFLLSSVVNNNWNLKMNFGLTKIITVNTIMIIDYIVVFVFVITYYIEQKQEYYKYLTTCHSIIINLWLNRIRSDRRAVCNMGFATMAQPKFLCSTWFSKSLKRPATKQRSTCIYEWDDKSSKGFFQKKKLQLFYLYSS